MAANHGGQEEIAGFLNGDPSSVGEISSAVDLVVRTFRLHDHHLHDDLVQDALRRVLANLRSGRFRGESSLKTYAQTIARYTCLAHLRRKKVVIDLEPDSLPSEAAWSGPEEALIDLEEHEANLRAFAALPPDTRELLHLVFVEGLSYRQVAERLGLSEGAIKSRIRRCRLARRDGKGAAAQARTPSGRPRRSGGHGDGGGP